MTAVNYLWDPVEQNIVRELDDSGNVIAQYTTEPGLYGDVLSQRRNGEDSYYHYDGQGSTLALTNSNGDVTDTYEYSAFGEVTERTGSTVNPFQYIGQTQYYRDTETGEYEVRRRPLSSQQGRWYAIDSIETHLFSLVGHYSPYVYSHNNCTISSDPSGYWPYCQGTVCMNTFFGINEGIYGLKVEVVPGNSSVCGPGGPKILFTYIETHVPPPGTPGGLNPKTNKPSPCLEPANWELSQADLKKWKFGRITDRNCSAPIVKTSTSKQGGCITISISWTCDTVCERDNGCICGPRLPWMGIYSPWWDPHDIKGAGSILPEAILTQASISYEEAGSSCGLTGCKATALLFKLNNYTMGPLPGHDKPNQPGDVKRDPIYPDQKWEPGDFFFIGIPPKGGCTAAEERHLWGMMP